MPEWRGGTRHAPGARDAHRRGKLEHVAAGSGIVILPLSTATFDTRPDATYALVDDIAPNEICVARDSGRRSPLLREFVDIAHEHRFTVVAAEIAAQRVI